MLDRRMVKLLIVVHPAVKVPPLTEKQMEDYELKPAPGNPDRVRPSITARLKDETRGKDPSSNPDGRFPPR